MLFRDRIAYQLADGAGGDSGAAGAQPAAVEAPGGAPAAAAPPAAEPVAALDGTLLSPKESEKAAEPAIEIKADDYKDSVPEGLKADDPLVAKFFETAAGNKLSKDAVAAVLKDIAPVMQQQAQVAAEAQLKTWTDLNTTWANQVKSDPEMGGAKFEATVQRITSAIDLSCTPEQAAAARQALTLTGAGNHPAIVGLLYRMASRLTEGGLAEGGGPTEVKSPSSILYPTHVAG